MANTQDAVHDQIDRDIFLREALARDFASPKSMAIWLRRYRDVQGSVDAIIKAIERYELDDREEVPYESAWEPLNHANIDQLGEVCLAVVEKSPDVQEVLPELHRQINSDYQEILYVVPSSENITLIFEPEHEEAVQALFPPDAVPKISHDLHLFSFTPTGRPAAQAPPTSALVTSMLSTGIEIRYVLNAYDDILLIVESEDYPATFRHLNALARNGIEPDSD